MAAVTAPEIVRLKRDAQMPNSALPVLVYRQPLSGDDLEKRIRKMFEANHWHGIWRNGIYDYHHFHSNAHEVLGIAHGTVEVKLGGDSGETLTLAAGDVVVLPAGTGHCRLSDGRGLVVMGGYPKGQEHYDICRSLAERPDWAERIGNVALPRTDPVFGEDGALLKLWRVG